MAETPAGGIPLQDMMALMSHVVKRLFIQHILNGVTQPPMVVYHDCKNLYLSSVLHCHVLVQEIFFADRVVDDSKFFH